MLGRFLSALAWLAYVGKYTKRGGSKVPPKDLKYDFKFTQLESEPGQERASEEPPQ